MVGPVAQDLPFVSGFLSPDFVGNNPGMTALVFVAFSTTYLIFLIFFFMNGNTERAQCALSLVCIPQEKEKKGSEKNKTSLQNI